MVLLLEEAEPVVQVVPLLLQSPAESLQQLQLALQGLEVAVTQSFLQHRTELREASSSKASRSLTKPDSSHRSGSPL